MTPQDPARECEFSDIQEGSETTWDYTISQGIYDLFISAFGDRSPLHVDAVYARGAGFPDWVMHGTILNGFLSHFVGMVFPGRSAMLLSADLRYLQPCFLGDDLRLTATVAQKVESRGILVLHLRFTRKPDGTAIAAGKAHVMVRHA